MARPSEILRVCFGQLAAFRAIVDLAGTDNLEVNSSSLFPAIDFPSHGLLPHSVVPLKRVFFIVHRYRHVLSLGGEKAP
jgi:hypothetical protein